MSEGGELPQSSVDNNCIVDINMVSDAMYKIGLTHQLVNMEETVFGNASKSIKALFETSNVFDVRFEKKLHKNNKDTRHSHALYHGILFAGDNEPILLPATFISADKKKITIIGIAINKYKNSVYPIFSTSSAPSTRSCLSPLVLSSVISSLMKPVEVIHTFAQLDQDRTHVDEIARFERVMVLSDTFHYWFNPKKNVLSDTDDSEEQQKSKIFKKNCNLVLIFYALQLGSMTRVRINLQKTTTAKNKDLEEENEKLKLENAHLQKDITALKKELRRQKDDTETETKSVSKSAAQSKKRATTSSSTTEVPAAVKKTTVAALQSQVTLLMQQQQLQMQQNQQQRAQQQQYGCANNSMPLFQSQPQYQQGFQCPPTGWMPPAAFSGQYSQFAMPTGTTQYNQFAPQQSFSQFISPS